MEYALAISAAILAVVAAWWLLGGRIKPGPLEVPNHRHVGPIVNGINHSIGCELVNGDTVPLGPGAELHAVLEPCGPLSGSVTFSYEVIGEIASANGGKPRACFYFQRRGDDWSGSYGVGEWKRWYSRKRFPLTLGPHGPFMIPFTVEHWKGVHTPPKPHEEHFFDEACREAWQRGIGFGGIDGPPRKEGAMHGITGTGSITNIRITTGD